MQFEPTLFKGHSFRLAQDKDVSNIRALVNASYKELADMGLNYTATYQDEEITRKRLSSGRAFLVEKSGTLLGTVLFKIENSVTGKESGYVSQLAVSPEFKKQGLGSLMMDFCEDLALREGLETVQLDTAKPAHHLVSWYKKRGYEVIRETRWEGKTYESWIFEKKLNKT